MSRVTTIKTFALAAMIAVGMFANDARAGTETLTVAGGCFWCVESDFESVRGVKEAVSGFAGGKTKNPTYKQVTGGGTGQFCDRGASYRTAIFAGNNAQRAAAEQAKARAQADLGQKVVTPILGASKFYPADAYHQDYYKSSERLAVTSVGVGVKKSTAYKRYRNRCGRDQRVKQLWGAAAPFAN